MEKKSISKFLEYMKKFLAMSFLSALAAFGLSYSTHALEDQINPDETTISGSNQNPTSDNNQNPTSESNPIDKNGGSNSDKNTASSNEASSSSKKEDTSKSSESSSDDAKSYSSSTSTSTSNSKASDVAEASASDESSKSKTLSATSTVIPFTATNEKTLEDIDASKLVEDNKIKVYDSDRKIVEGLWKWLNPKESVIDYITNHDLLFVPKNSFYDTLSCKVNVVNPGNTQMLSAQSNGDVVQNVSSDGTTSSIMKSSGVTWMKEESDGSTAWYGFEDPNGVLPTGSRVSVKWSELNEKDHSNIYLLLANYNGMRPEKIWKFSLQALDDKNNLVSDFNGKPLKVYIEIGDDWDINDIKSLYLDVSDSKFKKEEWKIKIEKVKVEGKYRTFAVIEPTHFSDHYVADLSTEEDVFENTNKKVDEEYKAWLAENPNASEADKAAKKKSLLSEEMKNLNEEEKKAYNLKLGEDLARNLYESVLEDYDSWVKANPNATDSEKAKKYQEILMEKYKALSDEDRALVDAYLATKSDESESSIKDESSSKLSATTSKSTGSDSTASKSSATGSTGKTYYTEKSYPSYSSTSSANIKTGDATNYNQFISMLLASSFTGLGLFKRKKD